VSLYLAALRGVDPADVSELDALKARMAAVPSSG
jgi:phosphoglucose isomerase-like protein